MKPPVRLWIALAALVIVAAVALARRGGPLPKTPAGGTNALELLTRFEEEQAQRYWAPELRAQKFGAIIDGLWNRINGATNKLAVLAALQLELTLPRFANLVAEELPHDIRIITPFGPSWRELIAQQAAAGWELQQCEFRHNAFYTNQLGKGVASSYYVSGHLANSRTGERAIAEGNVMIWWNERPDLPPIREADARQVQVRLRSGPPAFERVVNDTITPPQGSYFIDPLLVWDLEGDGMCEVILAAKNAVYRRDTNGTWSVTPLLTHDPGLIFTGILGDFTGNGTTDFLCANFDGLLLHEGTADGRFPDAPRMVWAAQPRLRYGQVMTAGDMDGDGDLDVFLGQYKVPYDRGQMPFPYFDANDGHPSFLLANNGKGDFADVTASAGLAAKRNRRVYSASLADLDRDADLDLVVISDFAGLDAYENDGKGRFKDVTRARFSETWGFGMGHAFADFERDGRLDILMIGMNSPVADRLTALRVARPYDAEDATMRERSTYGNRLFTAQAGGAFKQMPLSDRIARTGWSWGAAARDFDNDGFPDLYITNGHETKESVQDYETEFWLHDIYVGRSQENSLAQAYFQQKHARTRGRGHSYGGYEKNRFFLNVGGTNFAETAYLFGIALEQDSRNVAAEDFNGDGKLDLVVTTFEAWPTPRQTLQIFENRLRNTGNWVRLQLKPEARLFGAQAATASGAHSFANGDSYRTQQALRLHIGLGRGTNAGPIRITPVNSAPLEFGSLEINRLHRR